MALFSVAFNLTMKHEGGYVNDPDDKGGETYMGISRRFYGKYQLWKRIDAVTKSNPKATNSQITKILKQDAALTKEIENIYRAEYWNRLRLDELNNQALAHQMFDSAVNIGVTATIKLMQRICKLKETGKMSNNIINKLNKL